MVINCYLMHQTVVYMVDFRVKAYLKRFTGKIWSKLVNGIIKFLRYNKSLELLNVLNGPKTNNI